MLVHLAYMNTTRCGLRRYVDRHGTAPNPMVRVAEYHGTADDPLIYRPLPTCPACLANDPELRAYIDDKKKQLEGK